MAADNPRGAMFRVIALGWFADGLSMLWPSIATALIMIVAAVWESMSLGPKPQAAEAERK